ncbi:TMEM175 family protein [Williamsia sterculiae]|uniref:Uncharacterized membrane protein n=1 Tax=Williamsia sterculiae TaxID=1344003 RepID=A0A1N7CBV0_9NOCA|nr:TMEM175 family protein [Williamsia sterculiae]SIR61085.1 Uncharacterized membrane protein [Williamsia sterculiae]
MSDRQVDRLVNYSDAVVAIAVTLIALPLVDEARSGGGTAEFFAHNQYALIAAATSFIAITVLWGAHHRVLDGAREVSVGLVYVNAAWLASVVFVPIATVLDVSTGGNDRLSLAVYVITVLVSVVALRGIDLILADQHPADQRPPNRVVRTAIPIGLVTAALVLVLVVPALYLFPLILLTLERPLLALAGRPHRSGGRVTPV